MKKTNQNRTPKTPLNKAPRKYGDKRRKTAARILNLIAPACRKTDWAKVEKAYKNGMTMSALATLAGLAASSLPSLISRRRKSGKWNAPKRLQKRGHFRHPKSFAFWGRQNWTLSNAELVRITGFSKGAVRYNRMIHAPETHRKGKSSKKIAAPWAALDWSQGNRVLAKTVGCCVKTIIRRRRVYAPKTMRTHAKKKPKGIGRPKGGPKGAIRMLTKNLIFHKTKQPKACIQGL
ncbi:MAG: hypothetical protein LBI02_08110 [Opitutaceae bacterium]|jgi:lambda repressor-like predicted transcriptional regulator|nr:hypothetical protein [Opitutaceae bacterium]